MDFHTALATPRALELAGVDGPRTFTEHAEVVVRRRRARPASCASARRWTSCAPRCPADRRGALPALRRRSCGGFAAVGLTGTHAMDGTLETLDLLRELEARGDLVTRILTPFTIAARHARGDWEALRAAPRRARRAAGAPASRSSSSTA